MGSRSYQLAAALAAILLPAPVLAVTTTFSGSNIPNCTYSAPTKTYTCTSLPLGEWDDKIAIADGYSVKVTGNVQITYNQGLTMSGTARLETTGNLDISALPQQNLSITGGSLVAGGSYKMGSQAQTITANITAASMNLGGGSAITINGTLNSTGSISIPSHATINGNITSATGSINTNSPITINGNVSAVQGQFEVPSGSTVTGNVKALDVKLLPSPSKVIGNVEAINSIDIGSGSGVQGNIKADSVVMRASEAYVTGTAQANHISLEYHATIQQGVSCQAGDCSCVDNNSTYPVQCQPAAPAIHHLRLGHTGTGLTCTPSTVTVNVCNTADSNGVCTAATGGVSGNVIAVAANNSTIATVPFTIASGASSTSVSVPVLSPQDVTFNVSGLSTAPANARTCWTGSSASCTHTYADSELRFDIPNHIAGVDQAITIQALKKGSSQTCVPGFVGSRNIKFACTHGNPVASQLTQSPTINGSSMSSSGGKCDATGRTMALTFDSQGKAPATIAYADVGQVSVTATDTQTSVTGSDTFIAVPKDFSVTIAAATKIVGSAHSVEFIARNAAGATAPAFGKETVAPTLIVSPVLCSPATGIIGTSSFSNPTYSNGTGTTSLTWNETGTANVKVQLSTDAPATGYLGSGLTASGSSTGCKLTMVPHHFDVLLVDTRSYWYSGQPLPDFKVTARNQTGGIPTNYFRESGALVSLIAWDATANAAVPGTVGTLSPATITATSSNGTVQFQPDFKFATPLTPPTTINIRARGQQATNMNNAGTEATIALLSGRLRLSNVFGTGSADLTMKVTAEYWTGKSWFINAADSITNVPLAAVAITSNGPAGVSATGAPIQMSNGQGALTLRKPTSGKGTVDVALNLGATAETTDLSCLQSHPATVGANLSWLRSRNGKCSSSYDRDPSARATFGLPTPESRATVHFREVFN